MYSNKKFAFVGISLLTLSILEKKAGEKGRAGEICITRPQKARCLLSVASVPSRSLTLLPRKFCQDRRNAFYSRDKVDASLNSSCKMKSCLCS